MNLALKVYQESEVLEMIYNFPQILNREKQIMDCAHRLELIGQRVENLEQCVKKLTKRLDRETVFNQNIAEYIDLLNEFELK